MGKVVKKVFGGISKILGGSVPEQTYQVTPTPDTDTEPVEDLEEDKRQNAASRAALAQTAGGAAGEELQDGEVGKKRKTLLGN